MRPERKPLNEACDEAGIRREVFVEYVRRHWIHPAHPDDELWCDEDIYRARLIVELQRDFGVNDEAIPVILHLIDQLLELRALFAPSPARH